MKTAGSSAKRPTVALFNLTLSGGAGHYLVTLAEGLKDAGANVHLIICKKESIDYPIPAGVTLHTLSQKNTKALAKELKKMLLAIGEVDLVLSNSTPSNKILSRLSLSNAYHVVHSAETKNYHGPLAFLKRWWRKQTYRRLYSNKHLITVSQGLQRYITEDLKAAPLSIRTIYNPFDFKKIRNLAERVTEPLCNEPYIIHVGRLDLRSKRHDILLEAYKLAEVSQKLVLLGEGPDRQKIVGMIESLVLQNRVLLPGFSANPYAWIKHADLCVLSSDFEGFGRVLAEAAILKTPVVSTDCPFGPNELLTGRFRDYLVPVGDPEALAEAMKRALRRYPSGPMPHIERFETKTIASQILKLAQTA